MSEEAGTLADLVDTGPAEDVDLVTLTCSTCDETVTGAAKGRNSASWKLGTHRYVKHGLRGTGAPPRAKRGAPTAEEIGERPALGVVRDIAAQIGDGKRVPTADDLTRGLGRGLGLTTVAAASYAAESDPNIPEGPEGEALRDQLVDYLSLTDKAARDVMAPFGRAFAPTKLNKKYGRAVVDHVDLIASGSELVTMGMHWRRYWRRRNTAAAAPLGGGLALVPTLIESDAADAVPSFVTSPAPQMGTVLTADDVAKMQAGRA